MEKKLESFVTRNPSCLFLPLIKKVLLPGAAHRNCVFEAFPVGQKHVTLVFL